MARKKCPHRGKTVYGSRGSAVKALRRIAGNRARRATQQRYVDGGVYWCEHCDGYHITRHLQERPVKPLSVPISDHLGF